MTKGLKPNMGGVRARRPTVKKHDDAPAPSEFAISDDDLLDPGLDGLPRTYYTVGFCDEHGLIRPEMKTLRAAQLAKAWSRLGLLAEDAANAIAELDAVVNEGFTGDLKAALPAQTKLEIVARAETHDGPEAIRDWLKGAVTTFTRYEDVAACCAHLAYVMRYMRLDLALRAAKSPLREANATPSGDLDVEHARAVIVDDLEGAIFRTTLGEDDELADEDKEK